MRRYVSRVALALGIGLVFVSLACSKGGSGQTREHVLSDSLKAAAELNSYEVQVDGELRQGGRTAEVKLTYEFQAPNKLRWLNQSTTSSGTEKSGLLVIGDRWWTLEGETWSEEIPLPIDLSTLSAERIWSLLPFDSAKTKDKVEDVNGFKAIRFRAEEEGGLSLDFVAGFLVAADDPGFEGELTKFKVDYWTEATAGFPVQMKLLASGSDSSLTLNAKLTKANDSSIALAEPAAFIPRSTGTTATGTAAQPAATQPTTAAAAPASTSQPAATSTTAPAPTSTTAPAAPTSTTAPAVLAPTSTQAPQPTQAAQPTTAPPPPAPSPAAATGVAPATQEQPQAVSASANLPSSGSGGAIRDSNLNVAAFGLMMALAGLALLAVQADWWRPRRQAAHGVSAAALPPAHGPSSSSCSLREGTPNGPADAEIERLRQSLAALRTQLSRETAPLRAARAIDRLRRP